jgi:hypothetical protein
MAYSGGAIGGDNTGALSWSISLPAVNGTGLQVDGIGGDLEGAAYSGFGFQFFRRNPEYGMFGVKTYGVRLEDIDIMHAGLQGELYKGMLTLSWEAAMQNGDIEDDVYARLGARYYFSENLFIELGAGEAYGETYGRATFEWQIPSFGGDHLRSSFFVDASGGNGTDHILAGFKFYFGKPESLIRRHREDTLPNTLTDLRWMDTSGEKKHP